MDETPRSPITAFAGERLPGIGHNLGPPLDPGRSFRRFAWKKARAELMPRLPLEVVKRRVRRAKELGLAYPDYASILLGSGRDIIGFLFTVPAIAEEAVRAAKVRELTACDRLLMGEGAAAARLSQAHALVFRAVSAPPADTASFRAQSAAVAALLDPLKLPRDGVVMVGATPVERGWAEAGRLAKFLPAERYFSG
ncbi:MAG: hypothetical protein AAFN17_05485 [Pseudomonadota bacterium]